MFDDRFAEGHAPFGERIGIGDCPLCQRYAAYTVGHARKVQHFENQIDPMLRLPEQPTLAMTKFDLTGWHRASGDLILEAADAIVQLPVFTATRYQVQTESADILRCAFLPGRDHRQFRPGITREIFVAGKPPLISILLCYGLDRRSQV